MSANEPTAEEIREALDEGVYFCDLNCEEDAVRVLRHVRDVLLANPDRVRALLALTHVDLECGMPDDGEAPVAAERIQQAIDLHPDVKGGAK